MRASPLTLALKPRDAVSFHRTPWREQYRSSAILVRDAASLVEQSIDDVLTGPGSLLEALSYGDENRMDANDYQTSTGRWSQQTIALRPLVFPGWAQLTITLQRVVFPGGHNTRPSTVLVSVCGAPSLDSKQRQANSTAP